MGALAVLFPGALSFDSPATTIYDSFVAAWRFWLMLIVVLVIAYMSNPIDASFRTFLTDLSFHTHLRRMRSSTSSLNGPASDSHVLTFSNRISIQLKTPAYVFRSFGLFSTVHISSSSQGYAGRGASGKAVADQEEGGASKFGSKSAFFIGAFGHWWALEEGLSDDNAAIKDRLASSVMAMDVLDNVGKTHRPGDESPTYSDDKEDLVIPGDIKAAAASPKQAFRPVKAEFRAGQRRASPTVKSHRPPLSPTAEHSSTTTESQQAVITNPELLATLAEQKLALLKVSDLAATSLDRTHDKEDTPSDALKVVDEAIALLQEEIAEARSASAETQTRLQSELDELRVSKKEDEHSRSDAKAKTRVLEEAKRLVEIERAEADKKRSIAKQSRQLMQDHVDRMKAEVARLERKETDNERKNRKLHAEQSAKIARLQEELSQKRENVLQAESALRKVTGRVEALEQAIDGRKTDLTARRQQVAGVTWAQIQRSVSNPTYFAPPEAGYPQWLPANENIMSSGSLSSSPPVQSDQIGYSLSKVESVPPKTSFLEHRLWHHRDHVNALDSLYPASMPQSRFASVENLVDHSSFAPFGPDISPKRQSPVFEPDQQPGRKLALPFFMHGSLTSLTGDMSPSAEPSGSISPGPLSPMTPHQASLLPTHLFDLLDEDEDEGQMTVMSSPSKGFTSLSDEIIARPPFNGDNRTPTVSPNLDSDFVAPRPSPSAQNLAAMSQIAADWNNDRHPLSLNPSAKAFNFIMPPGEMITEEKKIKARGSFGMKEGGLRDVWNRATKKNGSGASQATFSPFDDDLLA